MFTGIIEVVGKVLSVTQRGTNKIFTIESSISSSLKIDQSVSHSGVCLTVTQVEGNTHTVEAVEETLLRSNIGSWEKNSEVNIERSMLANGRIDGHFVQGHVDTIAKVVNIEDKKGSWLFTFSLNKRDRTLVVEKGSIAINGISLTIAQLKKKEFSVAVIPYTFEHTTFGTLKKGDEVNIEFDILGKYINRKLSISLF